MDFQGAVIPKVVLKRDDEMSFDKFKKKKKFKFFLSFFPLLINFNLFFLPSRPLSKTRFAQRVFGCASFTKIQEGFSIFMTFSFDNYDLEGFRTGRGLINRFVDNYDRILQQHSNTFKALT